MHRKETNVTLRNIIASFCYEIISIIYGFVLPKLVLSTFGSETNGLVASLGQFLNYILLLEGGLTSVIKASLYKPLAENDWDKVSGIIKATEGFFRKLAIIFVGYSLLIAVIYPLIVPTSFSWGYIFSLTIIISISLFIQYAFSISYRLLIIADRKGYIVSITMIIFTIVNLLLSLLVVYLYPQIHVLKFANTIAFLIQPIIFGTYVNKHYKINNNVQPDEKAISQRWDGFGQNIAFFIHTNTDIVILTIFSNLREVSVYSVYFMIANALKALTVAISGAITPSLGKILAVGSEKEKNHAFDLYEFSMNQVITFAFVCGALLITPFVSIYTSGVSDVDYYRPIFGYLIIFAEAVYCFREPYVNVAYASGKFKETSKYAYIEAAINIFVSVILVQQLGIIGVAIGTASSMLYRYIAHVLYLKKHILHRDIIKWAKGVIQVLINFSVVCFVYLKMLNNYPSSFLLWVINATLVAVVSALTILLNSIFFQKEFLFNAIKYVKKK